jgi:hypothetical protein
VQGVDKLLSAFRDTEWLLDSSNITTFSHRAVGIDLQNIVGQTKLTFWNIHLPSRMHAQDEDIREAAKSLMHFVRDRRMRSNTGPRPELIAGDFNLSPYDSALLVETGFNASRSLVWARSRPSYTSWPDLVMYNPSWEILGRRDPPQGTFYATSSFDKPWYVFDQVLMSPDLVPDNGDVQIGLIEQVDTTPLCSKTQVRKPNGKTGSDHLPVTSIFRVE